MPSLTVIDPGFYSSIQDLGRTGFRNLGVPHAGAMDATASHDANQLLGNPEETAVLEMIVRGGSYLFSHATSICLFGAKAGVTQNNRPVDFFKVLSVNAGDLLQVGRASGGNFIYLAIKGGFQTDLVMESRSFYPGITHTQRVIKGDHLAYEINNCVISKSHFPIPHQKRGVFNCFSGPEFHLLHREQQEHLLTKTFTVSKNWNRMAFQLNEKISNTLKQLKSSPVLPGTVQLTPSGALIILMKDAQTTGGYPRVLQLREASLAVLSQKQAGNPIDFIIG